MGSEMCIRDRFKGSLGPDAQRSIQPKLNKIVREAYAIVQDALGRREEDDNGTRMVYDRARFDAGALGYFTYLPVPEDNVPWLEETPWVEPESFNDLDLTVASTEWLKVLGLEVVDGGE